MKRPWIQIAVGLVAAVLFAWPAVQAALRLCPDCGYEVPDNAAVCGHCNRAMPPAPSVPAEPPADPVPGPGATAAAPASAPAGAKISDALLDAQVKAARELEAAGNLPLAMLYARNAQALLALAGGAARADDRAKMSTIVLEGRQRIVHRLRECPVCGGSGLRKMRTLAMNGQLVEQNIAGAPCTACKGQGKIPGLALESETAGPQAEAVRQFRLRQQKDGLEESGGIWLPAGLAELMNDRQKAASRRAFGVACAACDGLGREACETCSGKGMVKCANKDCKQGITTCPDCKGTGKSRTTATDNLSSSQNQRNNQYNRNSQYNRNGTTTRHIGVTSVRMCPTCNGAGKGICKDCNGLGFEVCGTCEGRGEKVCRSCKGTGESPICTKCQGEGLSACTRCSGTGKGRTGECTYCRGQGVVLCKTCQGSGRISRR